MRQIRRIEYHESNSVADSDTTREELDDAGRRIDGRHVTVASRDVFRDGKVDVNERTLSSSSERDEEFGLLTVGELSDEQVLVCSGSERLIRDDNVERLLGSDGCVGRRNGECSSFVADDFVTIHVLDGEIARKSDLSGVLDCEGKFARSEQFCHLETNSTSECLRIFSAECFVLNEITDASNKKFFG